MSSETSALRDLDTRLCQMRQSLPDPLGVRDIPISNPKLPVSWKGFCLTSGSLKAGTTALGTLRGKYQVDFRINGAASPMFLHAISTPTQARDATITIYRFLDEEVDGRHVSVFKDASRIGKRVLSKLEVVCQESFHNLGRDRTTIKDFLLSEAGLLNEPQDARC